MTRLFLLLLIGMMMLTSSYSFAIEPTGNDVSSETGAAPIMRMSFKNLASIKYKKVSTTRYFGMGGTSYNYEPRDKFCSSAKNVGGDSILTDTVYFEYANRYVRVILSVPIPFKVQKTIFEGDCNYYFVNQYNGTVIGIGNGWLPISRDNSVDLSEKMIDGKKIAAYYRLNSHNEKVYFCDIEYPAPAKVSLSYAFVSEADLEKYKRLIDDIKVDVIYRKDE